VADKPPPKTHPRKKSKLRKLLYILVGLVLLYLILIGYFTFSARGIHNLFGVSIPPPEGGYPSQETSLERQEAQ